MVARFADRSKVHRANWSRTADLDSGTSDLLEEHTSDLVGLGTEDLNLRSRESQHPLGPGPGSVRHVDGSANQQPASARARSALVDTPSSAAAQFVSSHRAELKQIGPGSILGERFLLEKAVGSGGTAMVFSARDLQAMDKSMPRARIAIKVPKTDAKDPDRAVNRLQHEFRHAQPLSHTNIVQVFELGNDQDTWFMTMELIEGKSLIALMRDWQTLSDARKRGILRSCAEALSFAHSREIVHGDFKPANVLVSADGQAKVFDFGAASAASGDDTRIPAGTPAYASPQVLSGMRPEPRDDVFSFACVAYELLTGQHPFDKRSSLEARDADVVPSRAWNLSASQWLALLSALSWEREQRPESVDSLMQALFAEPSSASLVAPSKIEPARSIDPAELQQEIVPRQRGWGFFSFVVVALTVAFFISQRDATEPSLGTESALAASVPADPNAEEPVALPAISAAPSAENALMSVVPMAPARDQKLFSGQGPDIVEEAQSKVEAPKPKVTPLSAISFSSEKIMTPEGSIAAVFIVERSPPLSGRTTVQWTIASGTAAIDEDFIASPTGTVEFADGQAQRAIYIPLRNDLDAEGDETFSLELLSPRRGRLGSASRVEATIRDDDG